MRLTGPRIEPGILIFFLRAIALVQPLAVLETSTHQFDFAVCPQRVINRVAEI